MPNPCALHTECSATGMMQSRVSTYFRSLRQGGSACSAGPSGPAEFYCRHCLLPHQVLTGLGKGVKCEWQGQRVAVTKSRCSAGGKSRPGWGEIEGGVGLCSSCPGYIGCPSHCIASGCTDMLPWNQYMPLLLGLQQTKPQRWQEHFPRLPLKGYHGR